MNCRLLFAASLLLCVLGLSFPKAVVAGEGYYTQVSVEKRIPVYQCDKSFIGVDSLGKGLYLACFRSHEFRPEVPDLFFVIYNETTASVVGTFSLESTGSYKVAKTQNEDIFVILHSLEGYTSTCIFNSSAEILYNFTDVAMLVADRDLMGIRGFSPKKAGRSLGQTGLYYSPLPRPGPYNECGWSFTNQPYQMLYLSSAMVLFLHTSGEMHNPSMGRTLAAYDSSCNSIWECRRAALSFQTSGMFGGQLFGVITSIDGSELINMDNGVTRLLSRGGAFAPVIGGPGLFFHGRLDSGTDFTINRLSSPDLDPVVIAPYYSGRQPMALIYEDGILYADCGIGYDYAVTCIFARDFTSSVVLEGSWIVVESGEQGFSVLGGEANGGTLYHGQVESDMMTSSLGG